MIARMIREGDHLKASGNHSTLVVPIPPLRLNLGSLLLGAPHQGKPAPLLGMPLIGPLGERMISQVDPLGENVLPMVPTVGVRAGVALAQTGGLLNVDALPTSLTFAVQRAILRFGMLRCLCHPPRGGDVTLLFQRYHQCPSLTSCGFDFVPAESWYAISDTQYPRWYNDEPSTPDGFSTGLG